MRIHNEGGRLKLAVSDGAVDIYDASEGAFGPDPQSVYDQWDAYRTWAGSARVDDTGVRSLAAPEQYGPPSPRPRQIFAVALNYAAHAAESGFVRPDQPLFFTKFVSSLSGPVTEVVVPVDGSVDWEVELVVVIGPGGRHIPADRALDHVAGLTVGQDISERRSQHAGPVPQFSLAKSFAGFSPTGPSLVSLDEIADVNCLAIGAEIDGQTVQAGDTGQLIFSIPELIAYLSSVVELYPGDLIFTGTPEGVGAGRTPPRFLQPGEVLRSFVDGIGELRQTFVSATEGLVASTPDQATAGHSRR